MSATPRAICQGKGPGGIPERRRCCRRSCRYAAGTAGSVAPRCRRAVGIQAENRCRAEAVTTEPRLALGSVYRASQRVRLGSDGARPSRQLQRLVRFVGRRISSPSAVEGMDGRGRAGALAWRFRSCRSPSIVAGVLIVASHRATAAAAIVLLVTQGLMLFQLTAETSR